MSTLKERFLRYIQINTESDEDSATHPSTERQFNLAHLLANEMREIGIKDVVVTDKCYVYGTIPSNLEKRVPTIGFIAHMDTVDCVTGDVHPQIITNYDGKDIKLNDQYVLSPKEYPSLNRYVGDDLVTTSGDSVLGADDKAGVAEIMSMAAYLFAHPEFPHGTIKIGFTPDEEIGCGADYFDVPFFGADFAYTVDGGEIGEIEYENFNAINMKVSILGKGIHPGAAKGIMKNALLIGIEFQSMLPVEQNPAYTCGYEGFFHLNEMKGDCENAELSYIIRDHNAQLFEQKVALFQNIAAFLNVKYGEGTVTVRSTVGYRNMKEIIEKHMHLIDIARQAIEETGISAVTVPIRGGTDGARLSFMGLPCPNLATGGCNYHGRFEYISLQSMEKCVEMLINIVRLYGERELEKLD
ncbi:MAG: peptidase T [Lachnospiraceae bacterium]